MEGAGIRRINADLIDWQLLGHPARQGYRPYLAESLQPVLVVNPASTIQASTYLEYVSSFKSNTALAANANETILAPAANVNGAILWRGQGIHSGATSGLGALIAKAGAAPASLIDGDVLVTSKWNGASIDEWVLNTPIKIAAGMGLYFRNGASAETTRLLLALYTLL